MECGFCGKTLITTSKFVNDNDIVECSNCKNSFKFIPSNLKNKQNQSGETQSMTVYVFFLYRILISLLSVGVYYMFAESSESSHFLTFSIINFLPFITAAVISYSQTDKLINYGDLFDDKVFNTSRFWIIFSELAATIFLNLIFFIIQ
ncbi:MAG TPA: hypothetical protein PKY81_13370 [bacterium]|nr:hypothetical protein [bacterium]HPN31938.1 hypothetical protein [bacterium]